MFLRFFFFFFIITLFDLQYYAAQEDALYECYSWGDPHVQTWHKKGDDGLLYNQDCYTKGFYVFVRNEFVYYKVKVEKLLAIEVDLRFYDPDTKKVICMIESQNFEIATDDDDKCAVYGITWNAKKVDEEFIMNVNYERAKFQTSIRQKKACTKATCHYNIYVWQPQSTALRSTGICQRGNNDCKRALRTIDTEQDSVKTNSRTSSITQNQAEAICNKYVNAFLSESRRVLHRQGANTKNTIDSVLAGCIDDLILLGEPEIARSGLDVLMMEELTANVTSIDALKTAIESGIVEALEILNEAAHVAEVDIPEILGLTTIPTETTTTTTTTTTTQITTTAAIPLASFKCGIYESMYIQTWHQSNQASPPAKTCAGISATFEVVRNRYVRYTLRTSGSVIDELTLVLFNEITNAAICTVSYTDQEAGWMDCAENGINPSLIKTTTHETLTVYYARANFTTIVTRDIGINVGRFTINIYQSPELAVQSSGVCNLSSPCTGSGHVQPNKRSRRQINQ